MTTLHAYEPVIMENALIYSDNIYFAKAALKIGAEELKDSLLAGKTGTAEIKASKDDTSGTELGWFAVFTAENTAEHPIMIVSMVEDVKGRGGSGYVVGKDKQVLESWFGRNE